MTVTVRRKLDIVNYAVFTSGVIAKAPRPVATPRRRSIVPHIVVRRPELNRPRV